MIGKVCSRCKIKKPIENFQKKKTSKDGHYYMCRVCTNKDLRERRITSNNSSTKKYERTKKGKLVRTYRNMLSRVKGILKNKSHLYEGLPIIEKEKFYEWSLNDFKYNNLFDSWVKAGYTISKSPSIDRIDPTKGYSIDNIRWVTFSENCSNIRR